MPPTAADTASPAGSRLAALFVWCTWGAMTAALFGYVAAFARDVPWWDDWDLVPVLSGAEPASAAWLWEPHNEHRIPIPKLIHLALAAPAGADFRAVPHLNALALSAAALALIVTARRTRGRTAAADAVFPLALLHWGQYDNLLWSFQVQFVCSTVLFLFAVTLLISSDRAPGPGRIVLAGLCALALPFCGANGAALAPALALWLAAAGRAAAGRRTVGGTRCGRRRRGGRLLPRVHAAGAAPVESGIGASLRSALLVLLMADGPIGAVRYGPFLGMFVLLLAVIGCAALARASLAGRVDRWRGLGLVAATVSVVVLGAGVGWGRAGLYADDPGAITGVTRYVTLMAPLACCASLAWVLTGRRLVPYLLLAAVAVMLPANMLHGWEAARWRADALDRLTADAHRGVPPDELSATYRPIVHAVEPELLADRLNLLRRARLGPYRGLPAGEPLVNTMKGDD